MVYLTDIDKRKIIDFISKLEPYGKVEISVNQSGTDIVIRKVESEQLVIKLIQNC